MKKRQIHAKEYKEDYLLNQSGFDADFPGLQIYAFCYSCFSPQWTRANENLPLPYFLVSMVLSGENEYISPDGEHCIQDTDSFYVNDLSKLEKNEISRRKSSLKRYFILFHINRTLRELLRLFFHSENTQFSLAKPYRVRRCFEEIRRAMKRPGKINPALLSSLGYKLLAEAASQFKTEKLPVKLCRAEKIIEERFCDPSLTRQQIAEETGTNIVTLGKLFRQYRHTTVNQSVNALRIDKAEFLLKNSALSIAEISRQCGFSQPCYFSKIFRKYTGNLPGKYRRNTVSANAENA